MNIMIITAPQRKEMLYDLINELDILFPNPSNIRVFTDTDKKGPLVGHLAAAEWAAEGDGCLVIEDDALPVEGFDWRVKEAIESNPDRVISFYLGTGRPPQYQEAIKQAVEDGCNSIIIGTLIHGVCYYLPAAEARNIVNADIDPNVAADFAIGSCLKSDVIYPIPSLVDHADIETIATHPDGEQRTEQRKAWALASKTIREAEQSKAKG